MNKEKIKDDVRRLIDAYNLIVDGIDHKADESDRAYGGVIRAGKGALVESLAKNMVSIVWRERSAENPIGFRWINKPLKFR